MISICPPALQQFQSQATAHATTNSNPTTAIPVVPANHAIEETPSRGFARFMPAGLAREPGTLESPIASRKVAIQQTPSKPDKSTGKVTGRSADPAWGDVASTPLPMSLPRVPRPLVEASPNPMGLKGGVETETGKSIYETLGWDDEGGFEELA